ncbi:lamin tail-like protein [Balneicella halophila]|uniref:Lamin tail-like protein n=1 Tax=Balneicella halophila TaxID=1537566 RepID=A0A7L4UQD0_BALHA|nr:lamin tail domain-containing protein [Balneicella halophila]PVX51960.1 lamin tail-like protein [Balneicella halophila]
MKFSFTLTFLMLLSLPLFAQTTIWEENFNSQVGKGVSGDGSGGISIDLAGVNWTLDYSNCTFTADDDYVKVKSYYSGGRFKAKDCDGEAIWESEAITITNYTDINISIKAGETGNSVNIAKKYIKFYSVVDGVETLFATNGSLGDTNFPSATASTVASTGDELKIRIKLRSDYAQDVFFDDIKVTGILSSTSVNDTNSEISEADIPILAQTISVADASNTANNVFKFQIIDKGTADGKPTNVTRIILKKGATNTLDWSTELAEASIESGADSYAGTITANELIFQLPTAITIADGDSKELILKIKTVNNLAENTQFQTFIDTSHGFTASNTGSTFTSTLTARIVSAITTFDVKATKLRFKVQPTDTQINTIITPAIKVEAVDANGNVDTDYVADVILTATNISGTTTVTTVSGTATFGDIMFSNPGSNKTITASAGSLSSAISNAFIVADATDNDSDILSPSSQISAVTIASTAITQTDAVKVFRFTIEDRGSQDGKATIPTRIVLTPAIGNTATWTETISGVTLSEGTINAVDINDKKIIIDLTGIYIADGNSKDIDFGVFLKSNVTDKSKLQFEIPSTPHENLANATGSTFSTTITGATSEIATINVTATKIKFTKQPPTSVVKNTAFELELLATDLYGNIDMDYNESVMLTAVNITGTTSTTFNIGKATLAAVKISTPAQNVKILATSGSLVTETQAFEVTDQIDATSIIKSATSPATTDISPNETKELFSFEIEDKGGDGYPTKVTKIVIVPASSNQLEWSEILQNVSLKSGGAIVTASTTISDSKIEMSIAENNLSIDEGTTKVFTLTGTLTTSPIEEGKIIAFEIPANGHHAENSATQSSKFATVFGSSIKSTNIKTKIEATKIIVTKQPTETPAGEPITKSILAELVDDYGNLDKDNNLEVAMSVASGTGTLSPTNALSQTFNQGIAFWKNLLYNRIEKAVFKISSNSFSTNTAPILFTKEQSSIITNSNSPIQNDTISSSRNTVSQAKDLFKFVIKDKGDDGLPSIIQKIRLIKGKEFSQSRLYYLIGGIILKHNGSVIGQISKLSSSNGYSDVEIALNTPLLVADGDEAKITASIFLSTHKKLQEGEKIQLAIEDEHGWTIDNAGSLFISPLPQDIISPIFTIDAIATNLAFDEVPEGISINSPFSVTIIATDEQGNIDKDYNGKVTLSREAGTGILTSTASMTVNFTNGKATWTELKYDTGESLTLLASSPEFDPFESPVISTLDTDSELVNPDQPLNDNTISSLITDEDNPHPIFSFAVVDKGTEDDKPTILKMLTFKNAFPNNGANWKTNIRGAVLLQDGIPIATTDKITEDEIIFSSTNDIVSISNASKENLTLSIYLKYNNIEDNKVIQCKISSNDTDFSTNGAGTGLADLANDILSSKTTIEVIATRVDFLSVPYALESSKELFDVSLGARDSNGNIDTDYSESVSLKDSQILTSTDFSKGIVTLSKLRQSGDDNFELIAESGSLNSASQVVQISTISIDLDDDFEDGSLQSWNSSTDWKASILSPINGTHSLKHNLKEVTGTSYIAKSIGDFNVKDGTTVWRWQMKNGDWNPSSSNNFYYVLASESNDFSIGTSYIVGVNQSDSDKLLTLYKVQDGNTTTLISSEMYWNQANTAGIEVKLSSDGIWKLSYDNNGGFDNLYTTGTAIDAVVAPQTIYSGFVFNYASSSRAGLFWADDVLTYHFKTAPKVDSLKVVSATQLQLFFNQTMDKTTVEDIQNYTIDKNINVIKSEQNKPNEVILHTSELQTDVYELILANLKNDADIEMPDTTLRFNYLSDAKAGDVIINEIMADDNPAVQLPEREYIELYNTTDKPFVTTDWKITIGNYERIFPTDTIQPGEYVILCSTSAKDELSIYGKTIVITSFPALTNKEGTIILKNTKGNEIDNVTYSSDWYNDETKNDGGWSLERIDASAPSNSRSNWSASVDERGGTPGEKNSIDGIVLDDTPPSVTHVSPSSKTQLVLTINEPIDENYAKKLELYDVNGMGNPESITIADEGKQITLNFKEEFQYGKNYTLTIKEIIDLFGNALENYSAAFGLPELALPNEVIINEILFNPVSNNVDYVELYNNSSKILNLSTLFIATRDSNNELKSVYPIGKTPRLLSSGEFVVLTTDASLVAEQYFVKYPEKMLEMSFLPSFPNDEGTVVILNQESVVIDEFHYTDDMHLKLLVSTDGVSLERIYYDLPTQDANNWHSAAEIAGFGTPTYKNSVFSDSKTIGNEIFIEPKVFSPNGDGIDDIMQIHYEFDAPGQVANVIVFDSKGRQIIDLARNLTLDTKGVISWDGVNATNARARTGRYIIFIEIFDLNGNVKNYKRSCVLHGLFK